MTIALHRPMSLGSPATPLAPASLVPVPRLPAEPASTLVVNVQIAVPRDSSAAERVFALADRLHALAVDEAAAARVSTTVAVLVDESGTPNREPRPEPAGSPDLMLLADRRIALLGGQSVHLTRLEYDLLLYLTDNAGRVLTRGQLLRQVWGYPLGGGGRTVDVHVRRLRAKLGGRGPVISTVRGVGYRMDRLHRVAVVRDPVTA